MKGFAGIEIPYLSSLDEWPFISTLLVIFQIYSDWVALRAGADELEVVVADLLSRADNTPKSWDVYLLLACRSEIESNDEFNELASLLYDVRGTRKIVKTGVQDDLNSMKDMLKPFMSLTDASVAAKSRDPLGLLSQSMVDEGVDSNVLEQMISTYRTSGTILDEYSD